MQKKNNHELEEKLRSKYDYGKMGEGLKNKYVDRYQVGTNAVLLKHEVAEAFPTNESVKCCTPNTDADCSQTKV